MSQPYYFIRPVLSSDRSWAALDWNCSTSELPSIDRLARCYTDAALAPLSRILPLVVAVTAEALLDSGVLEAFNGDPVVFVLPELALGNESVMRRCKELRNECRSIAIALETSDALRKIPLSAIDTIRFDATFARQELSALDLIYASDANFRQIATHVDSHEMFGWLCEKQVQWIDGRFLTAPNPSNAKEPDLARLKLLKLLNLVKQDGDTREIEAIFREEAKLSYNLLRLVNSVAVGARSKISSFSQAIAMLGRRQLQRWLQLLIYANNLADSNTPNPLMQLAAARGRQMELLSAAIEPIPDIPELGENAFMTGLFSLLSVLINLPMNEILKELPLQEEVVCALDNPSDDGILGKLLTAVCAGETGKFAAAAETLSGLGIPPDVHAKSQVTAYYWASRINVAHHD